MPDPRGWTAETVDRVDTEHGELVLRRRGDDLEVVANGVFLMDTSDGRSERLLADAAVEAARLAAPLHVVVGGLGVGFTLRAALDRAEVGRVTVVEWEPALVGWHDGPLGEASGRALGDDRVTLVLDDVAHWLDAAPSASLDVVCLDVDNGPDWTVTDTNAALYGPAATDRVVDRLRPGGVLAVWSAAPAPAYLAVLESRLEEVVVHEVEVSRGAPDVVLVGRRPARGSAPTAAR